MTFWDEYPDNILLRNVFSLLSVCDDLDFWESTNDSVKMTQGTSRRDKLSYKWKALNRRCFSVISEWWTDCMIAFSDFNFFSFQHKGKKITPCDLCLLDELVKLGLDELVWTCLSGRWELDVNTTAYFCCDNISITCPVNKLSRRTWTQTSARWFQSQPQFLKKLRLYLSGGFLHTAFRLQLYFYLCL